MTRLFFALLMCIGLFPVVNAQEKPDTTTADRDFTSEDYERMIQSKLQIEYRNFVIEALELTEDEIVKFDPILRDYTDRRADLIEKKNNLLAEHRDEMAEEDDAKEKEDETAEFIEKYWEVEIAEMELKKDIFDRLGNTIPVRKAANFFLIEDMIDNQLQKGVLVQVIPMVVEIDKLPMADQSVTARGGSTETGTDHTATLQNVKAYDEWVMDIQTNPGTDHSYIREGLGKLVAAIGDISRAGGTQAADFENQKQQILTSADLLLQDPTSDQHAEQARQAFALTAQLLQSVQQSNPAYSAAGDPVTAVTEAAGKIDAGQPLGDQTEQVNTFFKEARKALSALSQDQNWSKEKE